ncbi:hypothetical protein WJX84_005059 [Apatococcus fuscideae]|uniref:Uncharacterized protein n=1 Tax=Apatococcus fuscideae TaxID=2026836 RepID=A0AAW1TA00_9CHLO
MSATRDAFEAFRAGPDSLQQLGGPSHPTDELFHTLLLELPDLDNHFELPDLGEAAAEISDIGRPSPPLFSAVPNVGPTASSPAQGPTDPGCLPSKQEAADQSRYQRCKERQQAQAAKLKDVNAAIASKTSDHANLLGEQAKLEGVLSAQQDTQAQADVNTRLLTFYAADGQRVQRQIAELRNMQADEVFQTGSVYAAKLRPLLLAANDNPQSAAGRSVGTLARHIIDGTSQQKRAPGPGFWTSISMELGLSPAQKSELLQARRLYLQTLGEVLRRRQCILAQMQELESGPADQTVSGIIKKASSTEQLVKQMQQNILTERTSLQTMHVKIFCKVLSAFQKATLIAYSWPHTSEILQLLDRLAVDAREPSAQQLMAVSGLQAASQASLA